VTRTFIDAGVLIAAASGRGHDVEPVAVALLDDPDRQFVSSVFLRMEVLPKAIYYRRMDEVAFYEEFFTGVAAWAEPLDRLVRMAEAEARHAGLSLPDALHVAAAALLDADELVTTERPGRAIFRVTSVPVRSIHPAAAVPS
jgi:predicted nucleic acid-binding protein